MKNKHIGLRRVWKTWRGHLEKAYVLLFSNAHYCEDPYVAHMVFKKL
uniref:Uncharacterized protein n=1 Tax=Anguilla anguilla TaxID=7936 RepID=A0A0E9XKG5_ANGAN